MVLREASTALGASALRSSCRRHRQLLTPGRRCISESPLKKASVTEQIDDLEAESSFTFPPPDQQTIDRYDPVKSNRGRTKQLPPSRYQYRPPKYYRGPLHPHQPPAASNPASRQFVPGPFSLPRVQQTYDSTIAQDLMTLCYTHIPKGFEQPPPTQRLRSWVGPSPYFKGRPLRAPRGESVLSLEPKVCTWQNVARLERIVVHTMTSEASASNDSAYLHVAGMIVQAMTNTRVTTHKARHQVSQWGLKTNKYVAITADLKGEEMYHFVSKLVELVLPRIKDWRGIQGTSGDSSGNISFGLTPEAVSLFPEIEVNYDMYPAKMIPGCHITLISTANSDKEARLLLTSLGFPFEGKLVD